MRNVQKRILSTWLAMCMLLAVLPYFASAGETGRLAPTVDISAKAAQPASASITFNGPKITDVTSNGLRISKDGDFKGPEMVKVGGQWTLKSNDYIYFFVDSPEFKNADTVTLEVTYYDNNYGAVYLEYVSSHPGEWGWDKNGTVIDGVKSGVDAYKMLNFPKAATKEFQTAWFSLDKCNFTKGHNQNAQFRFGYGSDIYIKSVKLTVGPMDDPLALPPPKFAPQTELNNIIGKGISGWYFNGDISRWSHDGKTSGTGNYTPEMWPYITDYEKNGAKMYQTNFDGLGDGSPALLYEHDDGAVITTHLEWLKEYGIDCYTAMHPTERFMAYGVSKTTAGNAFTAIMEAAEEYGRSFHVYYDLTNSNQYDPDEMIRNWKTDWILNFEQKGITSSPNYSHADGKPVVDIYGVYGSGDYGNHFTGEGGENQFGRMDVVAEMVRWFRERGYYVIGRTPDPPFNWNNRTAEGQALYASFDMLGPWFAGAFKTNEEMESWMDENITTSLDFCEKHRRSWAGNRAIDFMPVVWSGFGWTNMPLPFPAEPNSPPRRAGQFAWEQAYKLLRDYDIKTFFFSFDEFDEGQSFIKSSVDYFDVPTGSQYFLTLATDGWWLSSDYYLRTAGAIIEMLKDRSKLRPEIDIPHSVGPVYWRNSFEMRDTTARIGIYNNIRTEPRPNQRIDPCLNNPALLTDKGSGVTLSANKIVKTPGNSGDFTFNLAGSGTGSAYYKIADVKITAVSGMEIKYALKPSDEAGRGVFVDILFEDGSLLSEHKSDVIAARGKVNAWSDVSVSIPSSFTGKKISAVVVGYNGSGSFSASVDDIIIQEKPIYNLRVGSGRLNLRSAASTSASISTVLKNGERMMVLETKGAWSWVQTAGGKKGWVATANIGKSVYDGKVNDKVKVLSGTLKLRADKSTSAKIHEELKNGATLTLLDIKSSKAWVKVKTSGGKEGWVASANVGIK